MIKGTVFWIANARGYTLLFGTAQLDSMASTKRRIVDLFFGCPFLSPVCGNDQGKGVLDSQCLGQHIAAWYGPF